MAIKEIPENEVMKIPGIGKVVLIVKKQSGAKLNDYIAAIRENGEKIDRGEPIDKDDSIGIDKTLGGGIQTGEGRAIRDGRRVGKEEPLGGGVSVGDVIPTNIEGKIGSGSSIGREEPIDESSQTGTKEEPQKEEEKKKSPVGKWIRRGVSIGLATLLLATIINTQEITHDETVIPSDRVSIEEVSDISLIEINGVNIQYAGSVYSDPGKLIHDMRDAAIGENNGTRIGVEEYFANTTDESRVAEEEEILAISDDFQAQQEIITTNEQILSSSASDAEKKEALQNIIDAKKEIQRIYESNYDLYNKYASLAREAYARDGGDERTDQEIELTYLGQTEYGTSIKNLGLDINSLSSSMYVLDNPQVLFKEEPAPEGTVDTRYIIDTELFGHDIHIGEISSTKVTGLEYNPEITKKEGGTTVTNGQVVITEEAIQNTQTTRKGIFAVVDIVKRLIQGKETGEIDIFGKTVHDDPHIDR